MTDLQAQQLYFADIFGDGQSILIAKTNMGMNFYRQEGNALKLIGKTDEFEENQFDDIYGWTEPGSFIQFGHFSFDFSLTTILTNRRKYGTNMYVIKKDELVENRLPIWEIDTDLNIFGNCSHAEFGLSDLRRKGQENIIVHNQNGLNVYQLNVDHDIERVWKIPNGGKADHSDGVLFFPILTGQLHRDIVVINSTGLFLYKFNLAMNNYDIFDHQISFASLNGWTMEYSNSIQFEDIDKDGRDDMFFTGPQGIQLLSFDHLTKQWKSLLDNSELSTVQLHGYVLKVLPAHPSTTTNNSIIFTSHKNQLQWAHIIEEKIPVTTQTETSIETVTTLSIDVDDSPPVIPNVHSASNVIQSNVLLRDQMDFSFLSQAVDSYTGKVRFKLPLVDLSSTTSYLNLNLYYDGIRQAPTDIGVGWSWHLNYIALDHRSSVFPEQSTYFIYLEGSAQQLEFDPHDSTDRIDSFKLAAVEEKNKVNVSKIRYYKDEERWEIDYNGTKQTYGRMAGLNGNSVGTELKWKNWRGVGSSQHGLQEIPISWYLVKIEDKNGNTMQYTYDAVTESATNGKSFTHAIYLSRMFDNQGNAIAFSYAEKSKNEFNLQPLIDRNGHFNPVPVQTRYLTRYTLTTPSYEQSIQFIYNLNDGKRCLTGIEQLQDVITNPVIEFAYKQINDAHLLNEINLPLGTSINFDYQLDGQIDWIGANHGHRYNVPEKHQVSHGYNFVLISYLDDDDGKVRLRMFNQEMTKEIYSSMSSDGSSKLPVLGSGLADSYKIAIIGDFILTILFYNSQIQLCLIRNENGKWSSTAKYHHFSNNVQIQPGFGFIAVCDVDRIIENISWNKDANDWQKENIVDNLVMDKSALLQVSGKSILFYANDVLSIIHKNRTDQWQRKILHNAPKTINDINETLDKFQLVGETRQKLFDYFKDVAFQVDNNMILFNRWHADGMKIYTLLDVYILNSDHEFSDHQQRKILQHDLRELSIKRETGEGNEKNFITFRYVSDGTKFKLKATKIRGSVVNEIKKLDSDQRIKVKNDILKNITIAYQNEFLLDISEYNAALNAPTVLYKNHKITFDGDVWKDEQLSSSEMKQPKTSIPLGDQFILCKSDNNSTIKLYEQGSNINDMGPLRLDLGVKMLNQMISRYPSYLAYQQPNASVSIAEFSNDAKQIERITHLPMDERLSPFSGHQTFVTSINNYRDRFGHTLVIRPEFGMRTLLPNPIVSKVTWNFGITNTNGYQRQISYEYDKPRSLGPAIYYGEILKIPGPNKHSFGWIQEVTDLDDPSKSEKRVFNSRKTLVRAEKTRQKQGDDKAEDENEEKNKLKSILFDKTQRLEVARFAPYEMANDEIGYYGFEDYEVNGIINSKKWHFEETDVIKDGFSLTGRNYLKLSKNKTLVGDFKPIDQYEEYIVSCWIRSIVDWLEPGDEFPYVKATISDENGNKILMAVGEVKLQVADWYYVEMNIDFVSARLINKQLDSTKTNQVPVVETNVHLKVSISVSADEFNEIDIDHIRFSPLNSDVKVNVYDSKTKQAIATINSSGLIDRRIYDKYQKPVATLNGYGDLTSVNTYTQAASKMNGKIQPKCTVIIKPSGGFYEDFAPYSFTSRWKIQDSNDWQISRGQLMHLSSGQHQLELNWLDINRSAYGMRLNYSLKSSGASIIWNSVLQMRNSGHAAATIQNVNDEQSIPLEGEIVIVHENGRLFVWIDGGLYFDALSSNATIFHPEFRGHTGISNMVIFSNPSIQVTYLNALDEKIQEISLESANSAIITEFVYDELGRRSIITKPARITRTAAQSLLAYDPKFITNQNPLASDSVWKSHKLQGDATKSIGSYGFNQIEYCDNPLNDECAIGLPGRDFSTSGSFAKRFSYSTDDLFIKNLYPSDTHTYRIEHKIGNVTDTSVFDRAGNRVAWYVRTTKSKNLLSTYEYNDKGKLLKTLPPLYHEKVGTFYKSYEQLNSTTTEERRLQQLLGVIMTYDKRGNVISKTTPDVGRVEKIFDENSDQLKFILNYSNGTEIIENIIFFEYDLFGVLKRTGHLTTPLPSKDQLKTLKLTTKNTEIHQEFSSQIYNYDSTLRGRSMRSVTQNYGEPLIEETILNINKETASKRIITPSRDAGDAPIVIAVDKSFIGDKLRMIEYPMKLADQSFQVTYEYDKLGHVIGVKGLEKQIARFTYNSDGQIHSETHLPDESKSFTRQYDYNSAGFLSRMHDKFLTETISYTEGGYGGYGRADGSIVRTEFDATWHEYCDNTKLGMNEKSFVGGDITPELSAACFDDLKAAGYINSQNRQAKSYYPNLEADLPIRCTHGASARHIQNVMGKEGFPGNYGHSYDYGNYQELTKAKYFVGTDGPLKPLQPNSFAIEIGGVNVTGSQEIWKRLQMAHFLFEDNDKEDISMSHGQKGKKLIRSQLSQDLRKVNKNYAAYRLPVEKMLMANFCRKLNGSFMPNSASHLKSIMSRWTAGIDPEGMRTIANEIVQMLDNENYLESPLSNEFFNVLKEFTPFAREIACMLFHHFGRGLGEAEFDVDSFKIDANGNHRQFVTGFNRYTLAYRNATNQVNGIKLRSWASWAGGEQNFAVEHDSRGNVIQALHKGIERIEYHPVSNRAMNIRLVDGRTVTFYYDASGERVLKRVSDSGGQITKEVHYVRDENGRVLVERESILIGSHPDVVVTAYVYGPRGLLGFVRRAQFYSVVTDHEGSIRLVVRDGEVVAAYDYLPYGELMREYQSDPEASIAYRYTAQELDEETGLYNFHVRFYDPSIGRFYQIDPKEQYFSPYKYAGNSPISMIDPDGKFAWFLVFSVIALLLRVASILAPNSKFLRILNMLFTVATIPFGAIASIGAITSAATAIGMSATAAAATGWIVTTVLGVGGAYISMAVANGNEWRPNKWNWNSLETWEALFQGLALGSSLVGGGHQSFSRFQKLTSVWSKTAFAGGFLLVGTARLVKTGIDNNWDLSKPSMWYGIILSVDDAMMVPSLVHGISKSIVKSGQKIARGVRLLRHDSIDLGTRMIVKATAQLMVKGAGLVASSIILAGGNLDFSEANTYFNLMHGVAQAHQHYSTAKSMYKHRFQIESESENNKKVKQYSCVKNRRRRMASNSCNIDIDKLAKDTDELSLDTPDLKKVEEFARGLAQKSNKDYSEHVGEIPNAAVSVGLTDTHAFVAYAGNNADGYLSVYKHDNFKSSENYYNAHEKKNRKIFNEDVVASVDPAKNVQLQLEVTNSRKELNAPARKKYEEFMAKFMGNFHEIGDFPDKVKKAVVNLLTNFKENQDGKVPTDHQLKKIFKKHAGDIEEHFKKKQNGDKREAFDQQKKGLLRTFSKWSKTIAFPIWDETNCAEPHVRTLHGRSGKNIPNIGEVGDLDYLATYKIRSELNKEGYTLLPFERCEVCKITMRDIKNVLTDEPILISRSAAKPSVPNIQHSAAVPSAQGNSQNSWRKPISSDTVPMKNPVRKSWADVAKESRNQNVPRRQRSIRDNSAESIFKDEILNQDSIAIGTQSAPFHISTIFGWLHKGAETVRGLLDWSHAHDNLKSKYDKPSTVTHQVDTNATIVLLEMLTRKMTGEKRSCHIESHMSEHEAFGYGIEITEKFEEIVQRVITNISIDIDFPQLQSELTHKIYAGKFGEIAGVLNAHLKDAYRNAEHNSNQTINNMNDLVDILKADIDELIDQTLSQILSGDRKMTESIDHKYENHLINSNDFDNILTLNHSVEFMRVEECS